MLACIAGVPVPGELKAAAGGVASLHLFVRHERKCLQCRLRRCSHEDLCGINVGATKQAARACRAKVNNEEDLEKTDFGWWIKRHKEGTILYEIMGRGRALWGRKWECDRKW